MNAVKNTDKVSFASATDLKEQRPRVQELASGVYGYLSEFDPNCGFVVGDDYVVVIDTRPTPRMARGFLDDIRKVTNKPVKFIVLTHYHAVRVGALWRDNMPNFKVRISVNGEWFGEPHANVETIFNCAQVIAHLARTRSLCAGSIIGLGTISNEDPATGNACITEARVRQILDGKADNELFPYLKHGDRVRIEAVPNSPNLLFGAIDQKVVVRSITIDSAR